MYIVTRDLSGYIDPATAFEEGEAQFFETKTEVIDFLENAKNPFEWEVWQPSVPKITF